MKGLKHTKEPKIKKSIQDMKDFTTCTHEIARGNLDYRVNVDEELSKTRVGTMFNDINSIAEILSSYVNEISRVLSHLAVGDFTTNVSGNVEFMGDFLPIRNSIERLVDSLQDVFDKLDSLMLNIDGICDSNNTQATEVATQATEQAAQLEELSSTIRSIADISQENKQHSVSVSEHISTAQKEAEQGQTYMDEMQTSVDNVVTSSNNIRKIVEMISSISSQTKMLSLNASIEAARAGESGKGFAVVAKEIGDLAVQTSEAVNQTTELVDESIENVQASHSLMERTATSFSDIREVVNKVAGESELIANNAVSQSESIDNIVAIMDSLAASVNQNAEYADKSLHTNEELVKMTNELKQYLTQFILKPEDNPHTMTEEDLTAIANAAFTGAQKKIKTMSAEALIAEIPDNIRKYKDIECLYVMDKDGILICDTIVNENIEISNTNFEPAKRMDDLSHTKYFKAASAHPDDIYRSQEYISNATGNLCITFAKELVSDKKYIVCMDIAL